MPKEVLHTENIHFTYKDVIRITCSLLLLIKSLLLIVDDKYHVFYKITQISMVENSINYVFSALYLIAGLIVLFGIDIRKFLIYIIGLIFINIVLTFQFIAINHDLAINCSIAFFILTIFIIGEGNVTIDYLKSDNHL